MWMFTCTLSMAVSCDGPSLRQEQHPYEEHRRRHDDEGRLGGRERAPPTAIDRPPPSGRAAYGYAHSRLLLVLLAHVAHDWRSALLIVQPDTLLRWRRHAFCLVWRAKFATR